MVLYCSQKTRHTNAYNKDFTLIIKYLRIYTYNYSLNIAL